MRLETMTDKFNEMIKQGSSQADLFVFISKQDFKKECLKTKHNRQFPPHQGLVTQCDKKRS